MALIAFHPERGTLSGAPIFRDCLLPAEDEALFADGKQEDRCVLTSRGYILPHQAYLVVLRIFACVILLVQKHISYLHCTAPSDPSGEVDVYSVTGTAAVLPVPDPRATSWPADFSPA